MSLEGKEENKLVMEITTPTTPMNYRNELFNGEEDVAGVVKYLLAPSPQEILPRFKGKTTSSIRCCICARRP